MNEYSLNWKLIRNLWVLLELKTKTSTNESSQFNFLINYKL